MDDALGPHAGFTIAAGDIVLFLDRSFDPRLTAHHGQRHRVVKTYSDPKDGIDRATIEMSNGAQIDSPLSKLTLKVRAPRAAEPEPPPGAIIAEPAPIVPVERALLSRQTPGSAVKRQPKTAATRVRDSEARRRARGEVAVKVWVPDTVEARADIRAFAEALVAKRAKATS